MEDQPTQQTTHQLPGAFELFKPSWEAFKLNWAAFLVSVLVPIVAVFLAASSLMVLTFSETLRGVNNTSDHPVRWNAASITLGVVAIVLILIFSIATVNYTKLQSAKGKKLGVKQAITESLPFFWRLLGLTICRALLIFGGLILLIVPGFFMWKKYLLAPYYLMDQNLGVFEAMKQAGRDSKPFSPALWGVIGVIVLIQLVGIVPYIGWVISLVAGIVYVCAASIRYLQIKKAKA